MMSFLAFDPVIVSLAALFLFLSGLIKGAIGFGQPIIAVSLLSLIFEVDIAVTVAAIPLIVTNLKLAISGPNLTATIRRFGPLILMVVLGTLTGATMLSVADRYVAQIFLGSMVVGFLLLDFLQFEMTRMATYRATAVIVGGAAGLIGGVTSSFGPLIVLYLKSCQLPKEVFVSTLCLIILVGALTLTVSLGAYQIFTTASFIGSFLACIPTLLGLKVGGMLREAIDVQLFYRIVSLVIFAIGLNLIRAGLAGLLA